MFRKQGRLGQGARLFGTIEERRKRAAKYGRLRPKKRFRAGFDRTGGFYGRFRGSDAEMKFLDTTLNLTYDATAECSTSAATGNIHIVPQDDTQSGREGRQITIKSIQIRGVNIFTPGAVANAVAAYYLWVILDTQCNGANPAITDVFTTSNAQSCFLNLANDYRFKIIKKFKWCVNSTAGVTTAYNSHQTLIEWYKKCNIPITYDATAATGAITTTRQNNIFFAFGSTGVSDDLVSFGGNCRIRYIG